MKLRVLWVGKTQEEWVRRGIDEYAGRIKRYIPFELVEAREEKGAPPAVMQEREGERLTRLLGRNATVVLLDELGEEMTSPQLAAFMGKSRDQGVADLVFVIGGAYGVSEAIRAQAKKTLALSRLTFTHQMVRLFLLEQIYRGFTILNGEGYHH